MAGNNIGMAQAPRAIVRFGNPDHALGNEEAMKRALKALTPLTDDSLDIVGSFDHLHLDPLGGGNVRPCSPQSIFTKAMEALVPVQGPLFGFPSSRSRGGPGSPSNGTTHASAQECLMVSLTGDRSIFTGSCGETLADATMHTEASAPSQLNLPRREPLPGCDPARGN